MTWTSKITKDPSLVQFEWLTKPYILSKALKRISKDITVKVLDQRFMSAISDEYMALGIPQDELPFVRQVFLVGENQVPLTYGRVVIPKQTYQAHFGDFEKLGSKLLGESLLYNNPDVIRSEFEFACLENDPRQIFVLEQLPDLPQQPLWARRSVFSIKQHPLLVTELFLPYLPAYIPEYENA